MKLPAIAGIIAAGHLARVRGRRGRAVRPLLAAALHLIVNH